MNSEIPKQHLPLFGKTVLHHTLSRLCDSPSITGIVVGRAARDPWWEQNPCQHPKIMGEFYGGQERQDTVLLGLSYLIDICKAHKTDWVLIHDAARPCVTPQDIENVVEQARSSSAGAVLASKVNDTMKQDSGGGKIVSTLNRTNTWRAYTPQVFPLGMLRSALLNVKSKGLVVTDDSMAVELQGMQPLLVQGSDWNIKITYKADLDMAGLYLREGQFCV